MELRLKVKEIAKSKGIETAYQLKEAAKLSPSTAYRLFNNTVSTITLDTLKKVCLALDCDPGDIFTWSNKTISTAKKRKPKSKTQRKVSGNNKTQ
jgi:DNA-binding Xre family transcriptional regulator